MAGIVGSFFTVKSVSGWYSTLNKPSFNPPNWLFGPVWVTLYTLMGVSLFLIWQQKEKTDIKPALGIFAVQLILNTLWSVIFFGLHQPFFAFIEIIALWASILMTILVFHKVSGIAAYLLIPYFLWVSFAGILNFFLWRMN